MWKIGLARDGAGKREAGAAILRDRDPLDSFSGLTAGILCKLLSCFFYIGLLAVGSAHSESAGYLFSINGKDELNRSEISFFDFEAAEVIAFIIYFPVKVLACVVPDGKKRFSGHKGLNGEDQKISFSTVKYYINHGSNGISSDGGGQ
jgi:hypothetical protein